MSIFKSKTNISVLNKICLTGLFIALTAILQKVLAVNYLPALPFLRVSFGGPALIIFSSILLGPIYGAVVGAGSDLLGYFIFDMSGRAFSPQITAIYAVLGFVAYFVFYAVKAIKSKPVILAIEGITFLGCFAWLTYFLLTYHCEPQFEWIKIVGPVSLGVLFIALFTFIIIFNKKGNIPLGYNAYQISLCAFILDAVVIVAFGTLMKAIVFGMELYTLIVVCQVIVMFFNVTISTIVLCILLKLCKKYFVYDNIK